MKDIELNIDGRKFKLERSNDKFRELDCNKCALWWYCGFIPEKYNICETLTGGSRGYFEEIIDNKKNI